MTLIAHTLNYSNPILIGDILMSTNQIKRNIGLPQYPEGTDDLLPENQQFFPFSLRQKIYIITENLAIGLAGLEYEIKRFLEDIKLEFKYKECTKENFDDFITRYDFSILENSACIITFVEKLENENHIYVKKIGPWHESSSLAFEHVAACGTGSKYFIEKPSNNEYISGGTVEEMLGRAIALNYVTLSSLLGEEKLTLNTIRESWGAGYELIYLENGIFKKLDDITYIIWRVKFNIETGERQSVPFLILNYRYIEDMLLITATDGKDMQGYAVSPLDKRKEDIDMSKFPSKPYFKAKNVCSFYVCETSDDKIFSGGVFTVSEGFPPLVSVDISEEGYLEIMIKAEIEDELMETIKNYFQE